MTAMFVQAIELDGADGAAVCDLLAQWHKEQLGEAPGYQGYRVLAQQGADRVRIEVDFASREEAARNSEREVTGDWARRAQELAGGREPVYHDYDVLVAS